MSKINSYKDLKVWSKSVDLAKEIYIISNDLPDIEKFGLSQQMRRSSVSISSNIAEGWGRNSSGNFSNFLKIAKGSLCELETQLILSLELNLLKKEKVETALDKATELNKMIRALIEKVEASKN